MLNYPDRYIMRGWNFWEICKKKFFSGEIEKRTDYAKKKLNIWQTKQFFMLNEKEKSSATMRLFKS